jgi:class 3 adenylate cyclase/tetratricopeptide (TPR) repeat protein
MSPTLDEQIEQLKHTIAEMESQRDALGDEVVDAALAPLLHKLDELVSQLESHQEPIPQAPMQQRKLVTLLFMDVVGSTGAIAAHLDPEDTLEIMDSALKRLAVPIEEHGGHVTRFMGDGFKAVFGAPLAREDDPEQAVRAGLDILDTSHIITDELEVQWDIQGFQVRVGVNTGLVALGGLTEAEDTVMGKPVNLAARLESAAPPGGLLISQDTYRHVRGVFDVEPLEPIEAKGFDEPVPVYQILRAKPRAFRVPTLSVEGVETRMVGRVSELTYLQDALHTAIEEGEGQVVTICGEAGVGKSRMMYEFQNWIELLPQDVRFFQGRGRQEAQGLPYSLLRDLFTFRYQIQDDDPGSVARQKVEAGFCEIFGTNQDGQMRAHILAQLLGFDFSASLHLKGVLSDPEQLRNRGLMYLGEYFQAVSVEMPSVIILEDIHWADDSSLDAVNLLGYHTPQLHLLIVCAARPSLFERRPHWGEGLEFHRRLNLEPLSIRESRQLVNEILHLVDQVPVELRELVVRGSEGNPFYLEELIKMLVEEGVITKGEDAWLVETYRLAQIDVPSTLAGVLQARLDSLLPEERAVLQQASVVGRQFWDRVVAHIHTSGEGRPEIVPEVLTSLRSRELIYRREESAFVDTREYIFKHDLLREVTYESVLKRLRKVFHELVAVWLIEQSAERIKEYSGLIAEHLLLAGKKDQSREFFIQAGDVALASYANPEAERYFRQALALSPTETQQAALFSGLGETLCRQAHYQEALDIWLQGIALYQTLGDSDGVAGLYALTSRAAWLSGDHSKAWSLCQEGLTLMEGASESTGLARLLAEAGRTAWFSGMEAEITPLCVQAVEMAERLGDVEVQLDARNTLSFKSNNEEAPGILEEVVAKAESNSLLHAASRAHHNLAERLRFNGELVSARQHFQRAADIARQMGDAGEACLHLSYVAEVSCSLGKLKAVEEILEEIGQMQVIAPDSQAQNELHYVRNWLLFSRGEWAEALELTRLHQAEARRGGDLYRLSLTNQLFSDAILELNRFEGFDDWEETEVALVEAIQISDRGVGATLLPRCRLAIVLSRQGRCEDAHHLLEEAKQSLRFETEGVFDEILRVRAEFELAFAEERWHEAVNASQSLIEINERTSYRWMWARQLIDMADILIRRKEPGDIEKAHQCFQQSLVMFTEMDAPGYIKVLEERLHSLNSEKNE